MNLSPLLCLSIPLPPSTLFLCLLSLSIFISIISPSFLTSTLSPHFFYSPIPPLSLTLSLLPPPLHFPTLSVLSCISSQSFSLSLSLCPPLSHSQTFSHPALPIYIHQLCFGFLTLNLITLFCRHVLPFFKFLFGFEVVFLWPVLTFVSQPYFGQGARLRLLFISDSHGYFHFPMLSSLCHRRLFILYTLISNHRFITPPLFNTFYYTSDPKPSSVFTTTCSIIVLLGLPVVFLLLVILSLLLLLPNPRQYQNDLHCLWLLIINGS